MKKLSDLTVTAGTHIHTILKTAVEYATYDDVEFDFNGHTFLVRSGETFDSAKARFLEQTGIEVLTPEESMQRARESTEKQTRDWAKAIADAKVPTEVEMQEANVPWPDDIEGLTQYINSLVERPHDYGTCVYAMSMAAEAAFNYVANKLGVTGFQAGAAGLDFLRRVRRMKSGFRIIDYNNLLYPQYLNDESTPGYLVYLRDPKIRERLVEEAKKLMENSPHSHPDVVAHWQDIIKGN